MKKIHTNHGAYTVTTDIQKEIAAFLYKNNVLRDIAKKIKDKKTLEKLIYKMLRESGGYTSRGGYFIDSDKSLMKLCLRLGYKNPMSKAYQVDQYLRRLNDKIV